LFNLLAAASLALCVAMVAAWARSYRVADALYWIARTRQSVVGFDNTRGQVVFARFWVISGPDPLGTAGLHHDVLPPDDLHSSAGHVDLDWQFLGFFVKATRSRQNVSGPSVVRDLIIAVPTWFPVLILTLPPAIWLKRLRARYRQFGRCTQCGYDLRATPERCPECRTIVKPPA
jgi:hypothetical protein